MRRMAKKSSAEKKIKNSLDQKLPFTYPSASIKDVQATGETFNPLKRTSSTSTFLKFNFFVGHFCHHGSRSGSTDLIESGSETLVSTVGTYQYSLSGLFLCTVPYSTEGRVRRNCRHRYIQ